MKYDALCGHHYKDLAYINVSVFHHFGTTEVASGR